MTIAAELKAFEPNDEVCAVVRKELVKFGKFIDEEQAKRKKRRNNMPNHQRGNRPPDDPRSECPDCGRYMLGVGVCPKCGYNRVTADKRIYARLRAKQERELRELYERARPKEV